MLYIVNGGVYKVYFSGASNSEFEGLHPALLVRTLKEDELYIVIPLTSYTKERMDKTREKGFGKHIKSTNSIAKIDKFQIIHVRDIKGRWKDGKENSKIELNELIEVNRKLNQYIKLSSDKSEKEYIKYQQQYNEIFDSLKELSENNKPNSIFSITISNEIKEIKCEEHKLAWLSKPDIGEIVDRIFGLENATVEFNEKILKIVVKNN